MSGLASIAARVRFSLNDYLIRFAGQNVRRDIARTYVAVSPGSPRVLGYYALSSGAVVVQAFPESERGCRIGCLSCTWGVWR